MRAWGAQVVSAHMAGVKLFYAAPEPWPLSAPVRGGVPVLFPQFADRGSGVKHGWARQQAWTPRMTSDASQQVFELKGPDHSHLMLFTEVTTHRFSQRLVVENQGDQPLTWTGGLHPYWAVEDVTTLTWSDPQGAGPVIDGSAWIEFERPNHGPWHWQTQGHSVTLSATGFTHWMIWNPGAAGAQQLPDLPDEDWRRFVCIEPVMLTPQVLLPGAVFEGAYEVVISSHTYCRDPELMSVNA